MKRFHILFKPVSGGKPRYLTTIHKTVWRYSHFKLFARRFSTATEARDYLRSKGYDYKLGRTNKVFYPRSLFSKPGTAIVYIYD